MEGYFIIRISFAAKFTSAWALARGGYLILDYDELEELAREDGEPVGINLAELQESELSRMPEGITFLILESGFPETSLWRENDKIVAEITEHIYTKYWWHKYHARSFIDERYL